ncbi:MAG: transcriptional regulator [Gordonia sp.]|uniref:MarR family winged helix-turn-helix transcriptional regulator n=1 Tax=Gordonia sp. (in: high G+C Gram-positive bacteria) TaxID=84139 RepID=UPI000C682F84|nr:MarR family transcriptional regulator [Gordonia sp. (in: high G+C Gram-positive bacteria)]MAU81716.1 transcriptional regulator [Gordonia sp. (in: high G+C Gram-positive bacteria)]
MTDVRLDEQLCFALYSASRAVIAAQRPGLAELGLTYPQYLAMLVLWEEDEITVSRLCRRLQLDSGTVSPLLRRLETLGYLSRRRSASDERSVTVALTPEGVALGARADCVYDSLTAAIAEAAENQRDDEFALDTDDLAQLRSTLHQLTDELRRHLDEPTKGRTT